MGLYIRYMYIMIIYRGYMFYYIYILEFMIFLWFGVGLVYYIIRF